MHVIVSVVTLLQAVTLQHQNMCNRKDISVTLHHSPISFKAPASQAKTMFLCNHVAWTGDRCSVHAAGLAVSTRLHSSSGVHVCFLLPTTSLSSLEQF